MRRRAKVKEKKLLEKFKTYFTPRNLIIGFILLFLTLILSNIVKGAVLMILFFPLALYSARVTKFINGVTLETATASSVLMGYIYGPSIGALSAFVLTTWSYVANSIVKLRAYLDIIFTTIAGFLAGYLKTMGFNFTMVFIISIVIKNIVAFILNHFFFDPDKIGNMIYRVTHIILNIFIYRLLFELIYKVFVAL